MAALNKTGECPEDAPDGDCLVRSCKDKKLKLDVSSSYCEI